MYRKLGSLVVSLRIPLLLLWLALALVVGLTAPAISDVASSDQTSFLPTTAGSIAARDLEAQKFAGSGSASSGLLIFAREGGLTAPDRDFAESIHNWLLSPAGPAVVQDVVSVFSHPEQAGALISPDNAAMLLTVNFTVASFQPVVDEATYAIRERVAQGAPPGLAAHFTGEAGLGTDLVESVAESTDRTAIVTIALVIGLLFFIYRAPLAVLIPLVTITLAYLVARGVLGFLAQAGWQISSLLDTYMVVLVFGAGTDYSLFFISRFREELAQRSTHEAAVRSVQRIGAVISASAITTMVGLSALGMARFGIVQTMGPGLALAVGITLLAGLTLTPALLSLCGQRLFWPRKTSVENTQPSAFWVRVSNLVARRPFIPVLLITALLALPYVGLTQYRDDLAMVVSLPESTDSRQGFDALARHFPPGAFAPAVVLLRFSEQQDLTSPPMLGAVAAIQAELAAFGSVDRARSITDPTGDGSAATVLRVPAQLEGIAAALRDPPADEGAKPAQQFAAALAQVDALAHYLAELADAFPNLARDAAFAQARGALADLDATAAVARLQAHPTQQLRQFAAGLREPAPAGAAASPALALAPLDSYLAELSAAFRDVAALPAYVEARRLLAEFAQAASIAADSSNLSAQQRAAQITQAQALAGGIAARLDSLAGFFAERPDAVFFPTAAAGENPMQAAMDNTAAALMALRAEFAASPHPYFIPTSLPGSAQAANAVLPHFVSADRTTLRFFVTLAEDPLGQSAIAAMQEIRQSLQRERGGPLASAELYVGGATAEVSDMQRIVRQDLKSVGVVTVVGIFCVLALLLRSLVAPLYLVGTVVFSYGSSLGLVTLFFQGVLGHEGVYYLLPLTVMVMLIALGADYNVFLVHRIREESASLPLRDGVRVASARTGAIITAAGVILAGTFGALTVAPLQLLFQTGAAVALGILIDALIVRSLLVPGIVTLVGKANWWPASVRANWWPILPAGARGPQGGEQGLARGIVFVGIAALIAVTFATRGYWYADTTVAAGDEVIAAPAASPAPLTGAATPAAAPTSAPTPIPQAQPTPAPATAPASQATPTLAPPPTPTPAVYVVRTGDTLSAIAQAHGVTVAALAAFNEIADANVIHIGQRLRIPPP